MGRNGRFPIGSLFRTSDLEEITRITHSLWDGKDTVISIIPEAQVRRLMDECPAMKYFKSSDRCNDCGGTFLHISIRGKTKEVFNRTGTGPALLRRFAAEVERVVKVRTLSAGGQKSRRLATRACATC